MSKKSCYFCKHMEKDGPIAKWDETVCSKSGYKFVDVMDEAFKEKWCSEWEDKANE